MFIYIYIYIYLYSYMINCLPDDIFIKCFDYYFMLNLLKFIILDAYLFINDVKTIECNM